MSIMTNQAAGVVAPQPVFDGVQMGVGTWQWGDTFVWQYGRGYAAAEVRAAYDAASAAHRTFFDTADVYGLGRSERFLGEFTHSAAPGSGGAVRLGTDDFTTAWRVTRAR